MLLNMTKEIKYFQSYLSTVKNLSNKTIENYTNDLKLLENYLIENNTSLLNANNKNIYNYFATLDIKNKTFNRKITSFKEFYKFLVLEKYTINVVIDKLLHVKNEKKYPRIISYEDVTKLVHVQDDTLLGNRNKAIITLLYITGLRVSELCNLTFNNINFKETYQIIYENKYSTKGLVNAYDSNGSSTVCRLWFVCKRVLPGISDYGRTISCITYEWLYGMRALCGNLSKSGIIYGGGRIYSRCGIAV